MKNQDLFSSRDKSKNYNVVCCNFCLGALRVNEDVYQSIMKYVKQGL